MIYQLWDSPTANLLDESEDIRKILAYVRALIEANGPELAGRLSFLAVDDNDTTHEQLSGAALLARTGERIPA